MISVHTHGTVSEFNRVIFELRSAHFRIITGDTSRHLLARNCDVRSKSLALRGKQSTKKIGLWWDSTLGYTGKNPVL